MATGGFVRWQDPQGCQACRPAGRAILEVRAGDQRRNRPDARPDGTTNADRHRRRGDRVAQLCSRTFCTCSGLLLALLGPPAMSAFAPLLEPERTFVT